MKRTYHNIKVVAKDPQEEIWLSDEDGHLVVKKTGIIDEGLLPGTYYVEFGLGNHKYPIHLDDSMEFYEPD